MLVVIKKTQGNSPTTFIQTYPDMVSALDTLMRIAMIPEHLPTVPMEHNVSFQNDEVVFSLGISATRKVQAIGQHPSVGVVRTFTEIVDTASYCLPVSDRVRWQAKWKELSFQIDSAPSSPSTIQLR
jgi:hypothetical protein